MGARQAYSAINCLIYLPLCFFGIIALFLRVIAVVAVNPVIVSSNVKLTEALLCVLCFVPLKHLSEEKVSH